MMFNWFKRKSNIASSFQILKDLASLQNYVLGITPGGPKFVTIAQRRLLERLTTESSLPLGEAFILCIEALKQTHPPNEVYVATIRTFQAASKVKGEDYLENFPSEHKEMFEKIDDHFAGQFEVED